MTKDPQHDHDPYNVPPAAPGSLPPGPNSQPQQWGPAAQPPPAAAEWPLSHQAPPPMPTSYPGVPPPHPGMPPSHMPPHPQQAAMGPWQELRQPGVVSGAVKDGFKSWARGKLLGLGVMAAIVVLVGGPVFLWSLFQGGGGGASAPAIGERPPKSNPGPGSAADDAGGTGDAGSGSDSGGSSSSESSELAVPVPDTWRQKADSANSDGLPGYSYVHEETGARLRVAYEKASGWVSLEDRCARLRGDGGEDVEEPRSVSGESGTKAVTCAMTAESLVFPGTTDKTELLLLQRDGDPHYVTMQLSAPVRDDDRSLDPAEMQAAREEGLDIMRTVAQQQGFDLSGW